jgi:hypothetical protein
VHPPQVVEELALVLLGDHVLLELLRDAGGVELLEHERRGQPEFLREL